MNNQIQPPEEIFMSFAAPIDDQLAQKLFNAFSLAINNHVKKVNLLMYSTGGYISSGIALYNFLTNIPPEITTYNCGNIASIAVIVYLSGKVRKTSTNATFMFHRTSCSPTIPLGADVMRIRAESAERDDRNTETIWRKHITMTEDQWNVLNKTDLVVGAEEAIKIGLASEIADFKLPESTQLFNIA